MAMPTGGTCSVTVIASCSRTRSGQRGLSGSRSHPTLQASRFGLPDDQRDAFVAAYGQDIRSWDGYPVLHGIRELSTITALLRDAHADAAARHELRIRLRSLRTGDHHEWSSF